MSSTRSEPPGWSELPRVPGDEPVRTAPAQVKPINGRPTAPLPKRTIDYRLPEGTSIADAQALLGTKLDECRSIITELSRRTGLRLTLTRNFQIVLDLASKP